MRMTKAPSGPLDDEDIVPPSAQGATAGSGATSGTSAGKSGLRMPPIIDLSPHWGQRFIDGTKRLLRGTLYQLSLVILLLMALGLMVLTLMEAGNVKLPDWRQWTSAISAPDEAARQNPELEPELKPELELERETAAAATAPNAPLPAPATDGPPLVASPLMTAPDRPQAETAMTQTEPPLPIEPVGPIEPAGEIAALRQTLADTRRALADTQATLLEKQTRKDGGAVAQLTKRAALADLLLRLDDGVPFDDVLDAGQLDAVLHKNELAALALHAARGVPTEAGIKAQAETLPLILSGGAGADAPRLTDFLSWLAMAAPKLINIRQTPMAGAQKQLRVLYDQLQARDYRAAAATTRLLVLTYDDADSQSDGLLALQALYADLRAFSETRAARNDLRRDYMAGVRP